MNRLHSALCALLMLVMAVAPLMVQAGQLHAVDHAGESSSHFDDHHDDAPTPSPDEGSDGDAWHALAHASHCCGHAVAMLPAPVAFDLVALPTSVAASAPRIVEDRTTFLPFRPPIVD